MDKDFPINDKLISLRSELSNDITKINQSEHGIIIHSKGRIINYNTSVEAFFFRDHQEDQRGMDLCSILSPDIIDKRIIHNEETESFYQKQATLSGKEGLPIDTQIVSFGFLYHNALYKALIINKLNLVSHQISQHKVLIDNVIDNIAVLINDINTLQNKSEVISSMFNHLGMLSQAEIITLSLFNDDQKIVIEEIKVLNPLYYELNDVLSELQYLEMEPSSEALDNFIKGKLKEAPIDIILLTFNKLTPRQIDKIVNQLQIKKVLVLGIKFNNKLIGVLNFVYNQIPENIYRSAIELYSSFLGQIIQRIYFTKVIIEKDPQVILRSSSFPMAATSDKQIFQQVNSPFLQLLNYSESSDLVGKSIREITDRVVFDNLLTNIYIRKKRISDYYFTPFLKKDKTELNLLVFACPNYHQNDFFGALGIFVPVLSSIEKSENDMFSELKSIDAGIIICDINSNIISFNDFMLASNFDESKSINLWIQEYFEDKSTNVSELLHLMMKENLYLLNLRSVSANDNMLLFRYTRHQKDYFVFLTKCKSSKYKKDNFDEIANNIDYGIININGKDGTLEYVNKYILKLTGYQENELIGKPHYIILEVDPLSFHLHDFHKQSLTNLNNENNIEFDSLLISRDKKKHKIKSTFQKKIFNGKESFLLGIQKIENEENITGYDENLLNFRKRKNTGYISDLRSPLNNMIGLCQLSLDEREINRKNEIINLVLEQANKFNKIVDDITYISKLESGTMPLTLKEIDLKSFLIHILEKANLKTQSEIGKKISIEAKNIENINLKINSESNRIEHIFDILIDNVFKTQRNVKIVIGANGTENSDEIEFFVSTINLTRTDIINKITNLHNSYFPKDDSQFELSYSLCKLLIDSLNGHFTINTSQDSNHFSFFIPSCGTVTSKPILSDKKQNISGKKVLILTSDEELKTTVSLVWKKHNLHFDFSKGETKIIEELHKNDHDILMIDMEASDSKGIETLWLLKHKQVKTPIMAVLNNENNILKEKCLKIGCNDYISKPINETILLHKMNRILNISKS
jgi:PAS domain-containing protein